ncbi:MAG: hypothetical protein OXM02_12455 [Bacteroidota bacterium]|nr:hypothetical protein [Bacteroidota bacterium]MDE2835314.1 hypothetical protein [Bacteroidota bacterium]MDE2956669.1 hypothetical protein [Bacteroidota bacterium]
MFRALALALVLAGCSGAGGHTAWQVRSVTLDARNRPSADMLPALRAMGLTHITLVQFGFQRDADVPVIRMQPDARWYSESDRGARELAAAADSLGMGIIVKPHLWLGRYSTEGQSRSSIGYTSEAEWLEWESQYQELIMHYALLAEEIKAYMLVVGTELARSARERPQFWRALIGQVRQVYSGHLTYAANWWDEYEHVTFWEDVDAIGIQGYFELSDVPDPSLAELAGGWRKYKSDLKQLATETGRPVLFTEIGYRNVPDAAAKPWRWPSRDEIGRVAPDDPLQARLYESFFENFREEPWFEGAILWKWTGDRDRRRNMLDFSPQGKLAEDVIRRGFGGAP